MTSFEMPAHLHRLALLLLLCACTRDPAAPPAEEVRIKVGVDRALEGLAAAEYLRAAFENKSEQRLDLHYGSSHDLAELALRGDFDLLLLASDRQLARLETEGVVLRHATWAHEEFVFIGPSNDPMRAHGSQSTAELMRNLSRSSYLMLKPKKGTAEFDAYTDVLLAAGDPNESGSFVATDLDGVAFVKRVIDDRAFGLVRRSAILQAAKEGRKPLRVYQEGAPELVLRLRVLELHPERTKRPRRPELYDFLFSEEGRGIAEKLGSAAYGYPLYAPGEPPEGRGARVPGKIEPE